MHVLSVLALTLMHCAATRLVQPCEQVMIAPICSTPGAHMEYCKLRKYLKAVSYM